MLRGILMAVLVVLYTGNSFSQDKKIKSYELRGYVKDLQNVIFNYDPYDVTYSNLIHNRINFKWNISKSFYTRIEMRNRILYSEQAKSIPGYSKYLDVDDGYVKLGKLWVDESGWAVHSIFDRALLNYSTGKVSITAGRQRINWGVNTVWNPNDLFNAYNFLDFDYEERPGSDAVRVQYFMKTLSSLEVAVKPSKEENRSVAAILYKFNRWNYDFQFLTGVYYNDIALGTGWAGSIKNAGFKGEATYFINKDSLDADNGVISASAMLDYSFKNNWYVSASMLYISEPPPGLLNKAVFVYSDFISSKYLMPYQYTFYLGATKGFTPIINGNLAVVYSPTDNSTILFPSFGYSIAQNLDLDLILQSFFAETFGVYKARGNSLFLRLKFSF